MRHFDLKGKSQKEEESILIVCVSSVFWEKFLPSGLEDFFLWFWCLCIRMGFEPVLTNIKHN